MALTSRLVYVVTLGLALSACGPTQDGNTEMNESMTQDEAATKVQEHIDGTLTALPDEAELETRRGTLFAACDDPTDGGSRDRVTVSETFWVRGLRAEDNETNVDLVLEYWNSNGYEVVRDRRPEKTSISVNHAEDSFSVSVRISDDGSFSLAASSPCVWAEGTPNS